MPRPPAQSKPPVQASRKRYKSEKSIAHLLTPKIENMGLSQGVVVSKLLSNWPALCPLLHKVTTPLSCHKGNLKIVASTDSAKQELRYHAPALIALINQLLGFEGVIKITATTAPKQESTLHKPETSKQSAPPAPKPAVLAKAVEACKSVKDDGLREALTNLAKWYVK
ncbi:MAG: hypothetical protein COY40_05015 [Alphaproteobacteria bacterium CG_4_10_14_0_8_um_filter_53_9]|nr:MAG: hypothetical protein COY40_05015 [Alphaproteobacteria bacterium CG_4_10_14_0_8_um_filter_53_9]